MGQVFPRLLGDVGGTHARWAWQAAAGAPLEHRASYLCAQHATLQALLEHHLSVQRLPRPRAIAFGIATAITGDLVAMTNHPWRFSIRQLQAALGVERCLVLNDFAAVAAGLPALGPGDARRIGGGAPVPGATAAVLGPGTGLGVAGLISLGTAGHRTIDGEGGHVTLAADNPREAAVLARLQQRFGHASAERAVSGPGLCHLYEAVCALDAVTAEALDPAEVSARAVASGDARCVEALQLFGGFLGSVAGNLALTLGARGGVYIAGGIVPRLGPAFDALPFRERFVAKGRFRAYLEAIPTAVITTDDIALLGAAAALDTASV
jgi:glucokinase